MQLGLIGAEDFDLLAAVVKFVAHGCIDRRRVLSERRAVGRRTLHLLRSAHQCRDVDAGGGQGQQAYGREHREAAAHVVRDDERRIPLVGGERFQSAARLVGDRHDPFRSLLFAVALFDLGLYQAEGDGRFGRRARFRNHDGGDRVLLYGFEQFVGVVFRNILASEEHHGSRLLLVQESERVAHGFEHGLGAQIRTPDADADDNLGLFAEFRGLFFDGFDFCRRDRRREVYPAQEVVARAFARFEQGVGGLCFGLHFGRDRNAGFGDV